MKPLFLLICRSLEPYTEYVFNITPILRNVRGQTVNVSVRTLSDKPEAPPSNVSLNVVNSTVRTTLIMSLHSETQGYLFVITF